MGFIYGVDLFLAPLVPENHCEFMNENEKCRMAAYLLAAWGRKVPLEKISPGDGYPVRTKNSGWYIIIKGSNTISDFYSSGV
jgi:hypothetical protein